jgi:DNA helicase-2/ATP-dependent DNA helicase PcrA
LGDHQPPITPELMQTVYRSYERRKERAGQIDFEDLLELCLRELSDPRKRSIVHARYRAFTVDEYQDVNLLQQMLLEAWVGDRSELCVVGDDRQAIFSFTGADARYLLTFAERFPDAQVIRLEQNYRSTPEVLAVANRLTPRMGGSGTTLRAARAAGAHPTLRRLDTEDEEVSFVVSEARRLHLREGIPYEEMAVLLRINGRSEDYEEAFSRGGIPFQVRDGSFLRRPAARQVIARLRREHGPVAEAVDRVARACGLGAAGDASEGEEATRQADLTRLTRLAQEFPGATIEDFVADLRARFAADETGRGVVLLTYHAAKGLEFEAVFLPRLEEGEMPFALSSATDEDVAEERRLLFVGITRARTHLYLSWCASRDSGRRSRPRPSRFLSEIASDAVAGQAIVPRNGNGKRRADAPPAGVDPLLDALRAWRLRVSRDTGKPAYTVFANDTLERIAATKPSTLADLYEVPGVGPTKLNRFGEEVLAIVQATAV